MSLLLPRRRLIQLAAPAIVLARSLGDRAAAQFPQPSLQPSLAVPILNQLSSSTTMLGAYSTGRRLNWAARYAFTATNISAANHNAIFTNNQLDAYDLLKFANGLSLGLTTWHDQSGSTNDLPLGIGNSNYPPITGGGALNNPITSSGGSIPTASIGYNGVITGSKAPWFLLNPMNSPFGAVSKFFSLVVFRPQSGTGSTLGRLVSFLGTGDTSCFTSVTSCILQARNGSATTGAMATGRNSTIPSGGTGPSNTLTMQGIVYDGAQATYYIDRTAQTPGTFTGNLAATGAVGIGECPEYPTITAAIACDITELYFGIFTSAAATFKAGDWTTLQNNVRAYCGTP